MARLCYLSLLHSALEWWCFVSLEACFVSLSAAFHMCIILIFDVTGYARLPSSFIEVLVAR